MNRRNSRPDQSPNCHALSLTPSVRPSARRRHSHILQTQLEASDYPAALETCRRFGDERPQLWLEALRALTKQLSPPADVITTVLDYIGE